MQGHALSGRYIAGEGSHGNQLVPDPCLHPAHLRFSETRLYKRVAFPPGHALSGFGRSSAGGSSRRDQMVPDMAPAPSQAAEEAARIILGHGQGAYQQELSSPTPPERTDASSAERPAEQSREPAGFRENVQVGVWCRVHGELRGVFCAYYMGV
jgi:hypothetical protein